MVTIDEYNLLLKSLETKNRGQWSVQAPFMLGHVVSSFQLNREQSVECYLFVIFKVVRYYQVKMVLSVCSNYPNSSYSILLNLFK